MARHATNKYRDEYCEVLLDLMRKGKSIVQVLAHLEISKATFFVWLKAEPEFKLAYEEGVILSEAWWNNYAEENIDNPNFNVTLYNKIMGSRFGVGNNRKVRCDSVCPKDTSIPLKDRLNTVLADVADKEIATDELKSITESFGKIADIYERTDLAERIERLEAQSKANG